ncbi:hypothetical protein SAMN05880501_102194 [Ureibacillus xyleni]|uniref:Uncharacterized protein n=1 Tax=Ureibacillus xyleni TaxID=614648 RepID=A0A285RXQ5_9BACL|nr:hypothetical protein [Ureibacillus xyleni]SOB99377.1 hypothetical protein SAMN05880501_102194 [Ureibacillus xyleni]
MKQAIYGLILYVFLILPPVASLAESVMTIHMHMQMPLLVVVGFLFTPFLKQTFPNFFVQWNAKGVPGILLFMVITVYWMLPRAMDEALNIRAIETFKFISLPFFAGVPLRDSWSKMNRLWKSITFIFLTLTYGMIGILYILTPIQLCNNYLMLEQKTLGWSSLVTALCFLAYLILNVTIDKSKYE